MDTQNILLKYSLNLMITIYMVLDKSLYHINYEQG